ncbi:ER lumen protein-retaining receptor [Diabrotica virgifera virgifera]|uniref:ER lumen protein-retaining receptor-like n=1 Tax=Diabrotica virgifera virgifera TaxID=50390 RepID=A0A6P7FB96_DIAVI|nr:ER lumen protein-retaining receptor [Diabrotica virgifera virgifera]
MYPVPEFFPVVEILHTFAMCFLPVSIILKQNGADVSGKTQLLQAMVVITRYVHPYDTFGYADWTSMTKGLQIMATVFTVFILFVVMDSYDTKSDIFTAEILVFTAMYLALHFPIKMDSYWILWQFSEYLEAVSLLPQVYLVIKIQNISMGTAVFMTFMAISKLFYIFTWLISHKTNVELFYVTHISAIIHVGIFISFLILGICTAAANSSTTKSSKMGYAVVDVGNVVKNVSQKPGKKDQATDRTPLILYSSDV